MFFLPIHKTCYMFSSECKWNMNQRNSHFIKQQLQRNVEVYSTDLPQSHQIGVSLYEIVLVVWGGSPSKLGQQNVGSEQAIDLSDIVQVIDGQGGVVWQHTYLCKKLCF